MLATAPALMSTPEFILWSACVGATALVVLLVDQQGAVGPQARPLWQARIAHCFLDKPGQLSAVPFLKSDWALQASAALAMVNLSVALLILVRAAHCAVRRKTGQGLALSLATPGCLYQ